MLDILEMRRHDSYTAPMTDLPPHPLLSGFSTKTPLTRQTWYDNTPVHGIDILSLREPALPTKIWGGASRSVYAPQPLFQTFLKSSACIVSSVDCRAGLPL
jgi:hypothetical protein